MIYLKLTAACDVCGVVLAEAHGHGSKDGYVGARWHLGRAMPKGTMERVLYKRRTRHFCQKCADGPPQPKNPTETGGKGE